MIAKERLYLTADRKKVVKEGDSRAAFLLIAPGQFMADSDAQRYGLLPKSKAKQLKDKEDKELKSKEDKGGGAPEEKPRGLTITRLPTGSDKT